MPCQMALFHGWPQNDAGTTELSAFVLTGTIIRHIVNPVNFDALRFQVLNVMLHKMVYGLPVMS